MAQSADLPRSAWSPDDSPTVSVWNTMYRNVDADRSLISKIRTLSPQQVAEVEDFVDFLTRKARKRAAMDRLLGVAPALEAAGVEPMSEDEFPLEVEASRAARKAGKEPAPLAADRGSARRAP